jgi:hypothetical protein
MMSGTSEWLPPVEARQYPRISARGDVIVSRGKVSFFAQLLDLSLKGARFSTTIETLRPGQEFDVQLNFSGGLATGKIAARVSRMTRQRSGAWEVGVLFAGLGPADLRRLVSFIAARAR